ncbi:LysE family translocator [Bosea sp. 124]|uniref:LysE family translocator n=1 Tax=Bosea sp. 124 TaxID=2135642 RepID=UPI000D37F41A|nr:LysE family translocator [Bosea sp. 124]PTM38665.1 threonine/homoserine/homoserine lactone efflux protein [Bosea sp. 124]
MAALMPLILFVLMSTISPGGATTLATASGANFGLRRSLPLITGIAAGLAVMAASAAGGLAGILLAVPSLQTLMKAGGSLYLLWLAWQTAGRGSPRIAKDTAEPIGFLGGVGLLWINPKGWAMTLGAAASFAMLAEGPLHQALLLGFVFGLCALISLSAWCAAGFLLARALRTDRQWRILNIVLGILLAASIVPMWF